MDISTGKLGRREKQATLLTFRSWAHSQCLDLLGQCFGEPVIYLICNVNSICCNASLTAIAKLGKDDCFDGSLQLCIFEDYERTIAPEFER